MFYCRPYIQLFNAKFIRNLNMWTVHCIKISCLAEKSSAKTYYHELSLIKCKPTLLYVDECSTDTQAH